MISRRVFLKGLTLTAAGLLVPETVGKVFYSIPKVVVPQNINYIKILNTAMKQTAAALQKDLDLDIWTGNLVFGKDNWYMDGTNIVRKSSVFHVPDWNRKVTIR